MQGRVISEKNMVGPDRIGNTTKKLLHFFIQSLIYADNTHIQNNLG